MSYISDVIAGAALILGTINFYWQFIHKRKSLNVVTIEDFVAITRPRFAVLNGGAQRILITKLAVWFVRDGGKSKAQFPYRLDGLESKDLLLDSGAGIDCTVTFTQPISASFATTGEQLPVGTASPIYFHDVHLEIDWAETDGTHHTKSLKLFRLGFRADGTLAARHTLEKQVALYGKPSEAILGWVPCAFMVVFFVGITSFFLHRLTQGGEIPSGFRLVALSVPTHEARLVRPRDRIDVIATNPLPDQKGSSASTILQNILVIRSEFIDQDRGLVLVALNPNEAQYVAMDSGTNNLHITVRPKSDNGAKPMERIEARSLTR